MLRAEEIKRREDGTWAHSKLDKLQGATTTWYENYGITPHIVTKSQDDDAIFDEIWDPTSDFNVAGWFPVQLYRNAKHELTCLFIHIEFFQVPAVKFLSAEKGIVHKQVITDNYRIHSMDTEIVNYCKTGPIGSMVIDVFIEIPNEVTLKTTNVDTLREAIATHDHKSLELLRFSADNIYSPDVYLDDGMEIKGICAVRFGTLVPASIIAGAIYDFAGYLTTLPESLSVGSSEDASPMVEHVTKFLEKRSVSDKSARVSDWTEQVQV